MLEPISYDRDDVARVIEEEHHALRTVGRWLQSFLGNASERGPLEILESAQQEALRDFLEAFRAELRAHFRREEVAGNHCWLGGGPLAPRLLAQHAELLETVDGLRCSVALHGHGRATDVARRVHGFLLLLERHEAEERALLRRSVDA